ncbi:hypothetical protein Tco_0013670 [Tanacetum coccineum]
MSTANQKTLAESRALDRPLILEKGSFVPWASRFLRFLENKQEEGELMQNSIDNGPYIRKYIPNLNNHSKTILEPISKMTSQNKAQYFACIKVINYILQGIPNNIYNSMDACPDAQQLWKRIKRLMLSTLINVMDQNETAEYDELYDPLDLVANSYAQSLHSHASPSYSHSPQPYYVTHPSSMIDNDDDYQGVIQGDAQEDKLTTIMLLLARAITQHYSTPTNNFLHSSSNIRNQTVIQDGRLDIQRKNVGYAVNGNRNAGRQNRNQATNAKNGLVQSIKEYDQNVNRIPRTKSTSGKTNVQCYNCNRKDNTLEKLNETVIMMARIQPTNDKTDAKPTYDDEFISKVNTLQVDMINGLFLKSDHEQHHHKKLETIDSDIIFDDPYVDNNRAEKQRKLNIKLKKQKALLQWELETFHTGSYTRSYWQYKVPTEQDLYICVAEEDMACTTSTPDIEVTYMTETEVREFNAKLKKKHVDQYNMAYKSSLKTLEKQEKILLNNQLVFEEKIRVLSSELENTTNLLKYSEKVNAEMSLEKQDLQAKLENERAINAKWTSSSKIFVKLIDSSMTDGILPLIPEMWKQHHLYNRFVKTDRMKAVPPPLLGNYIPLSDPTDLG